MKKGDGTRRTKIKEEQIVVKRWIGGGTEEEEEVAALRKEIYGYMYKPSKEAKKNNG